MVHVVKSNILGIKKPMVIKKVMDFKPHTYIEVGVFNCETFFSVVDLMDHPLDCFLGFDLFKDPEVEKNEAPPLDTRYMTYADAIQMGRNHRKNIILVQGDTCETLLPTILEYKKHLSMPVFVFLDGGHSFETTYSDITSIYNGLCNVSPVSIWVDDSNFPGVSKAIKEFTSDIIREEYNCRLETQPCHITEISW